MYILTNKALEERESRAWAKGNDSATRAWQSEFDLLRKNNEKGLKLLETIITSYNLDDISKLKKHEIIEKFTTMSEELLDTLKNMRGE